MLLKTGLFLAAILFAAAQAEAGNTYELSIGQSAVLQSGDVALVRQGRAVSAISCAGGGSEPLPSRKQFEAVDRARFSDIFQQGADIHRSIQCSRHSAESSIRQAIADATNAARNACFETGYSHCAQPMVTDEQFSFRVIGRPGHYACEVLARIIGTN